jgi:RNA polymerase sigma factor (sigma-70 family)
MEDNRYVFQNIINDILQNDKELYGKWRDFASYLLERNFYGKGARHIKPEDIVNEVIAKVLTGKRKWDKKKVPNINTFMTMHIKSIISNLQKTESYFINFRDFNDDDDFIEEHIGSIHHTQHGRIEHEYEMREAMSLWYDIFEKAGDIECLKVLEWLRFEYKNYEIAEELNIETKQVENIKKRIRNKLSKMINDIWADG